MKKQFLFLAFFTLALIFAGTNSVFAQPLPRTLDCVVTEGPLNPLLGKTYTYSVTVPNTADFTGLTYNWMVTKDQTWITAGSLVANPTAAADYDVISGSVQAENATAPLAISWNTLATDTDPFFLLINVTGANGVCDPENMKVYKIVPVNMFTLDIANVDNAGTTLALNADGTAAVAEECVQNIQSVSWQVGTENALYDYGSNTLVWAVVAANFSASWTPTISIAGVHADETVESITWSTTIGGAAGGTFPITGGVADTPVPAVDASGNVGATGEIIYIRMVLDHTTATKFFEGLVEQNIILGVDGVTANGDPDVHFEDTDAAAGGTADCGEADGFENDLAQQNLLPRPAIQTDTEPVGGTEPLLIPVSN